MTDSNLEIDVFLSKCTHLVVKAERVVPNDIGRENEVSLSLLLAIQDSFPIGTFDNVIDIK